MEQGSLSPYPRRGRSSGRISSPPRVHKRAVSRCGLSLFFSHIPGDWLHGLKTARVLRSAVTSKQRFQQFGNHAACLAL